MEKTHESVLRHIKEFPEEHLHDYEGLIACGTINGAIDALILEAHSEMHPSLGSNGGIRCDVMSGPCACGAWH